MKIFNSSQEASGYCVSTLKNIIKQKPNALICLAAGHTSLEMFQMLIQENMDGNMDFSSVKVVGLDEWVGLSGDDDGSCENFLRFNLFNHINLQERNIRLFNGKADDLEEECDAIECYIEDNGGIDYMLLGVGMNGHLGLNEPGVNVSNRSHVVSLDKVTIDVADKYFRDKPTLNKGITLGFGNFEDSKHIQLLITGERKKDIAKRIFCEEKTTKIPASLLRGEKHVEYVLDSKASSLL